MIDNVTNNSIIVKKNKSIYNNQEQSTGWVQKGLSFLTNQWVLIK